jgi:hypothetical protein
LSELVKHLLALRSMQEEAERPWVFRGHRIAEWPLTPQIDRPPYKQFRKVHRVTRQHHERCLLDDFKRRARSHVNSHPENDWEWLAIAQHYGLCTRLVDWTINPLAAVYFAVEEIGRTNERPSSVVWAYLHRGQDATLFSNGPFSIDTIVFYDPPDVVSRIRAQEARFTAHPAGEDGEAVPWPGELRGYMIPFEHRAAIRDELEFIGVSRETIYPDLDGVCHHINERYRVGLGGSAPTIAVAR